MESEGFFCVMGAIVEHAHIAQDLKIGIVMHVNLHTKVNMVNIYFILQHKFLTVFSIYLFTFDSVHSFFVHICL